jgi:hypothetical protein
VASVGFAILAFAVFGVSLRPTLAMSTWQPQPGELEAVRAIHLPSDSVILANVYTEGFIRAEFGVPGLIDGRAPYTDAGVLVQANELLRRTRAFFADPAAAPFDFHRYGVTQVLVVTQRWTVGSPGRLFPTDADAIERQAGLEKMTETTGFRLYRVIR